MGIWILVLMVVILFFVLLIKNNLPYRYKIIKPKNTNAEKDLEPVVISGFSPKLSAVDIFLIEELLNSFVKKDDIVVVVTNQQEYAIKPDKNQESKLHTFNKGWYIYSSDYSVLSFFEMLTRLWWSHQGNDNGTSFFGCNPSNINQIISTLNDAIKNYKGKFITSDNMILGNLSNYINSVLFTISPDGDRLYINSCNKLAADEILSLVDKSIRKVKSN